MAASLNNLGIVARDRGELATAEAYYKRALAIKEKLAPDSLDVALPEQPGDVARDRGDLATREAYQQRALAIREKLAPDSLDVAVSLNSLGSCGLRARDLATAEAYHRRALAIREKLGPGSSDEAESQHDLGLVYRKSEPNSASG